MIGKRVNWRYTDEDNKPTRVLDGVVEAVHLAGNGALALVALDDGTFEVVATDCLKLDPREPYVWIREYVNQVFAAKVAAEAELDNLKSLDLTGQIGLIQLTLEETGLNVIEDPVGTTVSKARTALLQLVAELKELGEQHEADEAKIAQLIKERDEALTRAREAEAKPKKNKPSRLPEHES